MAERETQDRKFFSLVKQFGPDPMPLGATAFYAELVGPHTTKSLVSEFLKVKWDADFKAVPLKTAALIVIEEIFPDFQDHVSEEPDFYTEARELFKLTTRLNIVKSIVVMVAAKEVKDQDRHLYRQLMQKAQNLIDTSQETSETTRFKAIRIASMI